MKKTYKNTYGDGRVEYVEYEVMETEEDDEATPEDIIAAMEDNI